MLEYNQNVKKIGFYSFLIFVLVCTIFGNLCCFNISKTNAQVEQIRIIYNQAPVYNRADFMSVTTEERQNALIKNAVLDEVYVVIESMDNIYKIQLENCEGFILKSMAINNAVYSPVKKLNYNAEVILDSVLYQKPGQESQPKIEVLKGTKIYITGGYNQKSEYTQ